MQDPVVAAAARLPGALIHDPDRPAGTGGDRRSYGSPPLPALRNGNRLRAAAALQDGAHRPAVRLRLPAPIRAGLHPLRARLATGHRNHGPAAGWGADPVAAPLRPAADAGGRGWPGPAGLADLRMKVVALATLKRFWERHPDSEAALRSWYDEVRHAFRGEQSCGVEHKGQQLPAYRRCGLQVSSGLHQVHWHPRRVRPDRRRHCGASMNIQPIRTESDYENALREISAYVDNEPEPGSEDGDRFEILVTLVEAYEAKHYRIEPPDPIEAIRFRMEQGGLTVKDLVPSIGQLNRVYEVLNRKRGLTLEMIRKLHRNLGIPAESLIGR
ncbi:hypothetical protein G6F57_010282 [Rhizopus arrhizus]|nr:hypothetical protein G6F57_010282 [Rhizopus arrhizus]